MKEMGAVADLSRGTVKKTRYICFYEKHKHLSPLIFNIF